MKRLFTSLLLAILLTSSCYADIIGKSAAASRPVAPRIGLIAEFLYGNWSQSDATHVDLWLDSSGNGNHASNTTLLNQLKIDDYGLTRETADSYLSTNSASKINLGTIFTIVTRWRCNVDDGNYYSLWYFGNPLSGAGWMDSEFGQVVLRGLGNPSAICATISESLNQRITTAVTTNNLLVSVYKSGVMVDSKSTGILSFDTPGYFTIGNSHNAGWALHYGTRQSIRAIWIFNRILTAEELRYADWWGDSI